MSEPRLVCIGASSDGRTNRWRATCSCGKQFEPTTTRFAHQTIECPKCGKEWMADYNAEPATMTEILK